MPRVSLQLAYRWLNIDTYWDLADAFDPDDSTPEVRLPRKSDLNRPLRQYPAALVEKYPLQDRLQSGPRRSGLHDPLEEDLAALTLVEQLINQLQAELRRRNGSEARAKVNQIEAVCAALPVNSATIFFQAEAFLECGLAYRNIGENFRALDYFEKSLKGFSSQSGHDEAIVRWMIGVIHLETPKSYLNEGLLNWQAAWKIFATAASDNRRSRPESQWYRNRARRMFADLQEATTLGALPPDPVTIPPTSGSAGPTAGPVPVPPVFGTAGSGPAASDPSRPVPPPASEPGRPAPSPSVSEPVRSAPEASGPAETPGTPPPARAAAPDSAAAEAVDMASLSTRIFVTVPPLGPVIIGGSDTPKAEGELFWSHDLKTTVRLVGMVGGKKSAMVLERIDGADFPPEAGSPAQRQRVVLEEVFDRLLECQKWIWLPLPRPAGAALRFAEVIPSPSAAAAWLQLTSIPVCESVAADPWGTAEARVRESQSGSLTFPWVYFDLDAGEGKSKRYCLRGFKNEGILRLGKGEYAFMRVTGDSMNAAAPYPINPGDWVLVRRTDQPADIKIVVANVKDPATGDYQATLKRKRSDGLHSESQNDYPTVSLASVAGYVGEVVAIAKPDGGTHFQR